MWEKKFILINFIIGSFALIGLPWLSRYFSKDLLIEIFYNILNHNNPFIKDYYVLTLYETFLLKDFFYTDFSYNSLNFKDSIFSLIILNNDYFLNSNFNININMNFKNNEIKNSILMELLKNHYFSTTLQFNPINNNTDLLILSINFFLIIIAAIYTIIYSFKIIYFIWNKSYNGKVIYNKFFNKNFFVGTII